MNTIESINLVNLKNIIGEVEKQAWDGKQAEITLNIGEDVLTFTGYIFEPYYECFESTVLIKLNDECLFYEESHCVGPYKMEVIHKGKYSRLEDALSMLTQRYQQRIKKLS